MKRIGLTGGIGSGKSTVAQLFRSMGIPVYDSDARAKAIMHTDPGVKASILALFGDKAYSNEELNRTWIAAQVFGHAERLQQLNAIVHPAVREDILQWAATPAIMSAPYVIHESAILLEEQLTHDLAAIILIVGPESTRIQRVMERDQVSADQVRDRIRHQWPDERKIPLSDFVIFNDGHRSLVHQVRDIDRLIRAGMN
jgi:dephospho-CoA kinase